MGHGAQSRLNCRGIETKCVRQYHGIGVAVSDAKRCAQDMANRMVQTAAGTRQDHAGQVRRDQQGPSRIRIVGVFCYGTHGVIKSAQPGQSQGIGDRRTRLRVKALNAMRQTVHPGSQHHRSGHFQIGLWVDQNNPAGQCRIPK